jgi:hypothetical protein
VTEATFKRTWHVYAVGILAILLILGPAHDWIMFNTKNPAYLAGLESEWRAVLERQPVWVDAAWVVAIWGAVAGAILLLFRRRWAWVAFAASALALAADQTWLLLVTDQGSIIGSAIALLVFAMFAFYAWVMSKKGILR